MCFPMNSRTFAEYSKREPQERDGLPHMEPKAGRVLVEAMEETFVKGTCEMMCPRKEALFRQKENLLHKFEMKAGTEGRKLPEFDPDKVVKRFNRSAAGVETTNPSDLRPFPILMKTIQYLYREVFPVHKEKPLYVYNFMFDRFRAVRQDAVIQNLSPFETIKIFEPIAKFLIYFGYILVEEDADHFDAHINKTHLQECVKRLLVCYDECSETNHANRWDIESAYQLLYLGNMKSLTRGVQNCELSKNKSFVNCVKLSLEWYLRNYSRVLRLMFDMSPLLLCLIACVIPEMRRYILHALSFAFSSKNSAYPLSNLRYLLVCDSDSQVENECKNFHIRVTNGKVNFFKSDFNSTAKIKAGARLKWVDQKLNNCDLIQLLCFGDTLNNQPEFSILEGGV